MSNFESDLNYQDLLTYLPEVFGDYHAGQKMRFNLPGLNYLLGLWGSFPPEWPTISEHYSDPAPRLYISTHNRKEWSLQLRLMPHQLHRKELLHTINMTPNNPPTVAYNLFQLSNQMPSSVELLGWVNKTQPLPVNMSLIQNNARKATAKDLADFNLLTVALLIGDLKFHSVSKLENCLGPYNTCIDLNLYDSSA
jgi:hypothetical protein